MNNGLSDIDAQLANVSVRRQVVHSLVSARLNNQTRPKTKKKYGRTDHLANMDRYLQRRASFLQRRHAYYSPPAHQPPSPPLVYAPSNEFGATDAGNSGSNFVSNIADNDGDVAGNISSDESESDYEAATPIDVDDTLYPADEPEVLSASAETELILWPPEVYDCGTETLRGAHCGRFGTNNRQSIISWGPHHLSSWSSFGAYEQTNLTGLLPSSTIKKLVPLSRNFLGIVADLDRAGDARRNDEIVIFDINTALSRERSSTPLNHVWSEISSYKKKVSIIKEMSTIDDHTFFLGGEMHNNRISVHSFMYEDGTFANAKSEQLDAQLDSPASTFCYDRKNNRAIVSTNHGQMSVVDGSTGKYICGGMLHNGGEQATPLKISNLAVCPTSSHLMLATCSSLTDQLKIIDLRMPIRPVLGYGKSLLCEYPEEIVPAWNPYNGVIVAPYNRQQTGAKENQLTMFDTRFTGLLEVGSKKNKQLDTGSWSVSFGTEQEIDFPIMVTAGDNGTLGVFDYMDYSE